MSIDVPSTNYVGIQPSNLIERYKTQEKSEQKESKDTVQIGRDLIAELNYNEKRSASGTFMEGTVNKKPTIIKVVTNNNDETWYEGALDKTYILLHAKDNLYDGKYGNEDFSLEIDYNKPSKISEFFNSQILGKVFRPDYFNVKGNIGGKQIDIKLPNAKVPQDSQTRDLLTLLLEDNGLKAQTISGEVKSLKFAPSAIKNIKQKREKRKQRIDNDIKPIFMQGISTASGMVIGAVMSALLFKFGLKH